jgi:arylsulfatase A
MASSIDVSVRDLLRKRWAKFCRPAILLAVAMLTTPVLTLAQEDSSRVAGVPARHADSTRPSIILVLADDLGVEGINSYGGEYYTPRIDQLTREGMRFENAHATPLCTPTRVRIMTGLESRRNYVAFAYLAPGQRTFANVLKDAGYTTGMVGKWQLSGNDERKGITPQEAGFDEFYLWQLRPLESAGSRYWGPTRSISVKTSGAQEGLNTSEEVSHVTIEEGFGPDLDSDFAADFISRHRDRPFFLYYSMVLPHAPEVPTPASMGASGTKARFAGMVAYMDELVGRLLDRIQREGLGRRTVVIFTSDNGTSRSITSIRNGVAVSGGKGKTTVSGTHVPLIVWGPGFVPAGRITDGLFDVADVLPTLAELAHAPLSAQAVDGVSQVPVLLGEKPSVRDSIFMYYRPIASPYPNAPPSHFRLLSPIRFVFDANWKLYGDGRFMSVDSMSGIETEVSLDKLKGEAARRHAEFTRVLREMQSGS